MDWFEQLNSGVHYIRMHLFIMADFCYNYVCVMSGCVRTQKMIKLHEVAKKWVKFMSLLFSVYVQMCTC